MKICLTHNREMPHSGLCFGRVDLTHIGASIRPLHVPDVQIPRSMSLMGDPDSGIACDDGLVDGENGRSVIMNPGNFVSVQILDCA